MGQTFQCPNCGASLDYNPGDDPVIQCGYCRTSIVVPEAITRVSPPASDAPPMESSPIPNLLQPANLIRLEKIGQLARSGDKIEAVKLYRELFEVDLAQAELAVDRLALGEPLLVSSVAVEYSTFDFEAELLQLLAQGDRLGAVNRFRELTGASLKDAQEAVDALKTSGALPGMSFHIRGNATMDQAEATRWAYAFMEVIKLVKAGEVEAAARLIQKAENKSYEKALEEAQRLAANINQPRPPLQLESVVGNVDSKAVKTAAGFVGGISCLSLAFAVGLFVIILGVTLIGLASPGGPLEGVWNRLNPFAYARVALAFGEKGSGPGLFSDPRLIAVDRLGNIFIADYSDGRLQRFDSNGAYQALWNIGSEAYPQAMAVDPAGDVYLISRGEVHKYDGANGQLLGTLANPEDRYFETLAIGADGSLTTAFDSEDILRYDPNGQLVFSMAQSGLNQTGDAESAESLALDGVGNIYLLTGENAVIRYAPDGRLLGRFGSSGDEPGQFRAPSAIAVDGQGRIYVSDIRGIQVFANDGRYLDKIEVEGYAFALAFDQQGNLWAATNRPRIFKYHIAGR